MEALYQLSYSPEIASLNLSDAPWAARFEHLGCLGQAGISSTV